MIRATLFLGAAMVLIADGDDFIARVAVVVALSVAGVVEIIASEACDRRGSGEQVPR